MRSGHCSRATEFLGEVDSHQKNVFLGNASALLFPIRWPEPFGLVMVEAPACGTPVLALRAGSVPEVIENGRTQAERHSTYYLDRAYRPSVPAPRARPT